MRAKNEGCAACKFAVPDGENFLCRRYPPVAHALVEGVGKQARHAGTIGVFPPVKADAWCGEWLPAVRIVQ